MHPRCLTASVAILVALTAVFTIPRPARADVGDISVGGVWVCRITQPALGLTAQERAVRMTRQITEALSTPEFRLGATIYVRSQGADARIMIDKLVIVTVTSDDAKGTTVTTMELARQWAQRLAAGLSKALPDAQIHTF